MPSNVPLSSSLLSFPSEGELLSTDTKKIDEFEALLEKHYQHQKKVVALNSGTAALHLALLLAGVGKDDEVICQSFTYVATANPIAYLGAKPIFIDSERTSWNMCPQFLEAAILARAQKGKKPKAILFVHIYGMPADINAIVAIAKKYEILLIEDAAEAFGASYQGQPCGSFGDYGILSFNTNKIMTTMGGGL